MSDLRSLLQKDDPIRLEGEMSPDDAIRMQQVILSAAARPSRTTRRALTAALATGLFFVVVASGWLVQPEAPRRNPKDMVGARQQLQISAPGGTRVIWIFNPELDVR